MVAEALIAQEETTRLMNVKLDQKNEEIKNYEEQLRKNEAEMSIKEMEL